MTDDSGYPRAWDWTVEGDEVEGTFVAIEEAPTSNGMKPLVVLDVAGEQRTFWLFHEALRWKFAQELERRPADDLRVGEPVTIQRLGEKESANGRTYVDYRVSFPESPRRSPREILGVSVPAATEAGPDDQDVPF